MIDLHVHLFPPRWFQAVWRYFEDRGWQVHHQQAEEMATILTGHGVDRAVALSYPHRPGVAGQLNRFMESVGESHPLFLPFASVHVGDEDMRSCVDHTLSSPRLHGFKFQPLVQRFDINDPRLDYLYECCREQDFPILMHIGNAPISNAFVGFEHLRRLLGRFPQLRVCVAHMGAFQFDDFLRLLEDHPGLYLDTAMINTRTDLFDTTFRGSNELLKAHADRICFGSDWPNVPYPYQESLDSLTRFELPPEALAGLMGQNALRFLKLE